MKINELLRLIESDRNRWGKNGVKLYLLNPEYRLVYRYRMLHFYKTHWYFKLLYYIERLLYHRCCVRCGCDIPSHVCIGGGFKVLHGFGIVINSGTIIGKNCTIVAGTVIGANHTGHPIIGENVSIGANCTIIGDISIGDNVDIGAGAIVTKSIPDNAVVYGQSSQVRRIKENEGRIDGQAKDHDNYT